MFESTKTIIDEPIEIKREFTKINYNSYMDLYNVVYVSKEHSSIVFYLSNGDERIESYEGKDTTEFWFEKILEKLGIKE